MLNTDEMISVLLNNSTFVVMDIETTGLSPMKGAEIIEIGGVRWTVDGACKHYHQMVRPKNCKHIPASIKEITHITDDMVKDAPYIEEVLPGLKRFIGDDVVVFHNAMFDWKRFLMPAFTKIGINPQNDCICTLKMSKKILPEMGYRDDCFKLLNVCKFFGYDMSKGHAHRADFDAQCTAALLRRLKDEVGGQTLLSIPMEKNDVLDWNDVSIYRLQPWKKGKEERLYISTTHADIYYDYLRNIWSIQRLKSKGKDINMNQWEDFLVKSQHIADLRSWLEDHRPV